MPYMTYNQDLISMRGTYGHMFIKILVLGSANICVYQFVVDK